MFNCHATSTQKGDPSEAQAIKDLLVSANPQLVEGQEKDPFTPVISANKGNLGHLVAGAALTESAIAI